jgi:spermidine synthase
MIAVLVILGFFWGNRSIKNTAGQIYETESAYNYIQVLEIDNYRYLRLNEGQGVHSIYHPERLIYYGPWMQVLTAPYFNPYPYYPDEMNRVAIIGLAAGTIARQITQVYGPVDIDGFEIDPRIIEVGQRYFGMNMPNLSTYAMDGRWGLERSKRRYSIISIDAYRPPYIPWHMTTREFFEIVFRHLSEDGVLVVNVGRAPGDRRLIDGLAGTINSIFPSLYVMDIPDTFNSIIYATKQPTTLDNFINNYKGLQHTDGIHPILLTAMGRTVSNIQAQTDPEIVFTDDHAPIEWITNSMVLNYVLFDGVQELR